MNKHIVQRLTSQGVHILKTLPSARFSFRVIAFDVNGLARVYDDEITLEYAIDMANTFRRQRTYGDIVPPGRVKIYDRKGDEIPYH